MIVSDLERTQHPASIEDGMIRVRHLEFTPDAFVMSGIVLVSYSEEEERELVRLGLLASHHYHVGLPT